MRLESLRRWQVFGHGATKSGSNFYVLPGEAARLPTSALTSGGEHIQFFNWAADGSLLTSDTSQLCGRTPTEQSHPTA